ncbi:MAG: hypothetical protein A3K19_25465 [Lentisphaerae bacterium RIFOXYB12_FULL_65_16]|nr:MAG: hypothetical protein A3K18_15290 [Lentisphaerae bacterium RIFOXYA12_64_32]OGV84882.1 MAG: hypothetical protein A3K19_25465 [Lentisphaerae bacterium RIFOXYB12_FULL_65_16]
METAQAMGILKDRSVYVKMIQFRNFIVHRYESIDNAILSDICTHRLDDFETFIREIDGA